VTNEGPSPLFAYICVKTGPCLPRYILQGRHNAPYRDNIHRRWETKLHVGRQKELQHIYTGLLKIINEKAINKSIALNHKLRNLNIDTSCKNVVS
jgi:hypothetical protein